MKYFAAILLLMLSNFYAAAQNDCADAIIVCGNNNYTGLYTTGAGIQELGANACHSFENNSLWLKILIKNGGTLGFLLTPESNDIQVDYDFWIFGPTATCGNLGTAIRCSTTNPANSGQADNLTGMNATEIDVSEGPNHLGNSFIKQMDVLDGEIYYIIIDRPVGDANFSIEWTGTATFHETPVFLNPQNISLNLEVCDNEGLPTDQKGVFDLTTHSAMLIGNQNPVVLTYHENNNDALTGTAAIANTAQYHNTAPVQTIYMRMTNPITGCFSTESFEIKVKDRPVFNNPQNISLNMEACDTDGDGTILFNLTTHAALLINGQANVIITYHQNQANAANGASPMANPAAFSNPVGTKTIYMRIVNTVSGCFEVRTFTVKSYRMPVFTNPQNISLNQKLCDTDGNADHSFAFNLRTHAQMLLGTQPGMALTFYTTGNAAEAGTGAIGNDMAFPNTANPQVIYMRMTNVAGGCYITGSFTIEAVDVPIFNNPQNIPLNVSACDNDVDGIVNFDLTTNANMFMGGQQNTLLTYHHTAIEAANGTNPITNPGSYNNPIGTKIIYMRLANAVTGCYTIKDFKVTTYQMPVFKNPNNISLNITACDTDGVNDGIFAFNLRLHSPMLLGSQPGMALTYYTNIIDALAGTNAIANVNNYHNTANPQVIFMRMTNTAGGCFITGSFVINVKDVPVFNNPGNVSLNQQACDSDNNSVEVYNLALHAAMLTGNQQNIALTYHNNANDAALGTNPIASPAVYTNPIGTRTIYMRMANTITGCYTIKTFAVTTYLMPVFKNPQNISLDLTACDIDGTADQVYTFNLRTHAQMLLGTQPGMALTYYTNSSDAAAGTSPIPNPGTYRNTANPEIIYMRMTNTAGGCFITGQFTIQAFEVPIMNNPTGILLNIENCDTDGVDDSSALFDLTVHEAMLAGTQAGIVFTYHFNGGEAYNGTNAIANPAAYRNTSNPQQLFIRMANPAGCFAIISFRVKSLQFIDAGNPENIALCDATDNGFEYFDLSVNSAPLINGNPVTTVKYYRSQADAINKTDPLPLLYQNAAAHATETIWARLENANWCNGFIIKPFTISMIIEPEINYTVKFTDFTNANNSIAITMANKEAYEFSLDGITYSGDSYFGGLLPGLYKIYIRSLNQCKEASRDVLILNYPRFFTPNHDGINEFWQIEYLYLVPESKVYIFDRYGKLITGFNGTHQGWDGTYNGHNLFANDYWFLLELEDGRTIKSHFSLVR